MKKLLIAAFLIASVSFTNAQEVKYGVKAGFASLSGKLKSGGFSASGSDSGFFIGGFAEIGLTEKLAFKPELLYVSVGDLNQFQIPLHLKYNITEEFGLLAGPNLAFLSDVSDGFKSFNYGVDLGASYSITEQFVVDARYNLGLANLIKDPVGDDSYKISGFYVGFGYKF